MNKKAATLLMRMAITTLMLIFITASIFMIMFGGPEGLAIKIKDILTGLQKHLPRQRWMSQPPGEEQIPPDINNFYINFVKILKENSGSTVEKCHIKYNKMPKSRGYKIKIRESEKGMSVLLSKKDAALGEKKVYFEEIQNLKPCMVAGSEQTTCSFYYNWVYPESIPKGDCKKFQDFSDYASLTLNGPYDINGLDLEDNGNGRLNYGVLYKAKKDRICFIPTNDVKSYSEYGINDDYIATHVIKNMPECKT